MAGYFKHIQVQQFQDSATNKEVFQGGFKVKAHTGQGPDSPSYLRVSSRPSQAKHLPVGWQLTHLFLFYLFV
jgi:hypothetical protein